MVDYAGIIRNSVNMQDAAERYGLELNRAKFCRCPFHDEKTASFKVYDSGFYCFGCHAHGSVIDFVMQYFGLDFKGAIAKINEDFSLHLPIGEKPSLRQLRKAQHLQAERNEKKAERARLEAEYQAAMAEWVRLDRQSRDYAPAKPGWLHPKFVEALTGLQGAAEKLRDAEMRLNDYGKTAD